jgi:beta-galactosidase
VSTDAIVYANGAKCGAIEWPYGEVDISKAVTAGSEAMLWIQVMATSDETPSTSFLDPSRVVMTAANLQSKGLIGDVFLRSRPSGAHISDVFVQTSTRRKELRLAVEVSDLTAAEPVQFTAKLLDAKGMEEEDDKERWHPAKGTGKKGPEKRLPKKERKRREKWQKI